MSDAPTNRLYYSDAYRTEFTGTIVDRSADGVRVYLDETAFYPTSGGQPHDLGRLGDIDIVDVIDDGERVAHVLAAPIDTIGATVRGVVDWTRRYDHMQQHTGQHLLSAVFEDLFGFKTVSVHFGPETSTLDLDTETLSRTQLVAAEERANVLVGDGRPVAVSFEDAAVATGLRKPSDRDGTLRIVSIEGVDRSACGGTHVRSSAEIGVVLLRATEKVRRTTRVEFVCGSRAVRLARRDFEAMSQIAASLSASPADVAPLIAAQAERLKDAESARKRVEKELSGFRIRALYDATIPDAFGVRTIVLENVASMDDARALAQAALSLPRAVVVGGLTSPPSVLVAASDDSGADAGRLLKEGLAAIGGRGGGSPRIAQGSVPDAAAVAPLVGSLVASFVNRAG